MDERTLESATVLIVDDVRFNRDIVRQLLRGLGRPNVVDAEDGNQALRSFHDGAIDFVIADFDMPNCHGLQLLQAVRTGKHGAARGTPFAMLTSYSDVHLVKAALALDVNAFLIRPVSKAKLIDGFDRMLAKRASTSWLKPTAEYEAIDVSPARIAEWRILPTENARLRALDAMLPDSPLARRVSAAISDLASASGESVASRIVSTIDAFVSRGALGLDDLPRVVGVGDTGRSIPAGKKVSLTSDQARLQKAMHEIRNGAPLVADVHTADGKLFIEAGTELTPQILNIVINLDDLGLLKNAGESLVKSAAAPVNPARGRPAMQVKLEELNQGMTIAKPLKTADGRTFLSEGAILDEKAINQIAIAFELGQITGKVWIVS